MNTPLSYAQYRQEMEREFTRHTRACNKLKSRLLAFQKACKHKHVVIHGPIVGNYACTLCGKIQEDPAARIRRIASLDSQVKNLVAALGEIKNGNL